MMIKVFFGDDRTRAISEVKRQFGSEYEILEGQEITENILPSLFLSNSLFQTNRKILIRDLLINKSVTEKVINYIDTPHDVIILEQKIPKNTVFYKELSKKVEFREFKLPEISNYNRALNIYNTAKKDGKKAVSMTESIKSTEDPIAFVGIIISIALKEFESHQGKKEKRVLEELSKLDLKMKSTPFSPWLLLQAFLLELSSLES